MHLPTPWRYLKRVPSDSHVLDVGDCIQFILWETDVDLHLLSNVELTIFGGLGAAKGGAIDRSSHD